MLKEIRVPIIGYEGLYEISNYGNVYGLDRYVRNSETTYRLVKGKKLEPQKNTLRDNYLQNRRINMKQEQNKAPKFSRIRRVTGYLVGTLDRFNNAKKAEEKNRVKHSTPEK